MRGALARFVAAAAASAAAVAAAAAASSAPPPSGGAPCASSLDCWLNGDCASAVCVCDAAWTGAACDVLQQRPSSQLWPPPDPLPANTSTLASSWGSSIVRDEAGVFHMFVEVVCRTFTWMHIAGSVVVHATAAAVGGPYTFSDVALPQQSMTPHIVRDVDGAWLLLHQRNASVRGDPQCTGEHLRDGGAALAAAAAEARLLRASPPNATELDGPPSIARATSLYGPWTPLDFNITPPEGRAIDNPNPSLLPLPSGSGYLLAFVSRPANRSAPYNEAVSFAFAADWRSGLFTPIVGNGAPDLAAIDCEDPFLWRDDRGLHVVCHRRATTGPNPWNYTDCGGLGVSVDGSNWTWSPKPIYTTLVSWGGGEAHGAPIQFARRERPEFLLGADGRPEFLTNGVEVVTGVLGNPSMSIITPLGAPPPPPPRPQRLYAVEVTDKSPQPVLSIGLPVGSGHSPCNLTFNPAFLPAHPPGLNESIVIVRASGCPPEFGGAEDHLLYAPCSAAGVCGDVQPLAFGFEHLAEDPRVFFDARDGFFYLFYFANGTNQSTVFLRRSKTPLQPGSWELLASALPWHRNGCAFVAASDVTYVLWGETYAGAYPGHYVAGIGLSSTTDWRSFTTVNATLLEPANFGPQPEVCLEAATPPVRLSSGDWLHLFAAGTEGWGPWGPGVGGSYSAGWVVLDRDDPSVIVQRSVLHPFAPTLDYEVGSSSQWPVYRNNTLFVTSLVPVEGETDVFRAWYGAADANVATALVRVTQLQ